MLVIIYRYYKCFVLKFDTDEERRVRDEQERIQGIRDELKDKTLRINELEVLYTA